MLPTHDLLAGPSAPGKRERSELAACVDELHQRLARLADYARDQRHRLVGCPPSPTGATASGGPQPPLVEHLVSNLHTAMALADQIREDLEAITNRI